MPGQNFTNDSDFDEMISACIDTLKTKGAEYTGGNVDRLDNFRKIAQEIGIPMRVVWYVYFNKHLRALQTYVRDGSVKSNEPIESRIMDMINYLLLFTKMVKEK